MPTALATQAQVPTVKYFASRWTGKTPMFQARSWKGLKMSALSGTTRKSNQTNDLRRPEDRGVTCGPPLFLYAYYNPPPIFRIYGFYTPKKPPGGLKISLPKKILKSFFIKKQNKQTKQNKTSKAIYNQYNQYKNIYKTYTEQIQSICIYKYRYRYRYRYRYKYM